MAKSDILREGRRSVRLNVLLSGEDVPRVETDGRNAEDSFALQDADVVLMRQRIPLVATADAGTYRLISDFGDARDGFPARYWAYEEVFQGEYNVNRTLEITL